MGAGADAGADAQADNGRAEMVCNEYHLSSPIVSLYIPFTQPYHYHCHYCTHLKKTEKSKRCV